jgi:hypothetical protein
VKGDGVEKDEATGRKWLEESAKNGFGPAATKLEDLNKPSAAAKPDHAGKSEVTSSQESTAKTEQK